MKWWIYFLLLIGMVLSFFFFIPLFVLLMVILVIWLSWRFVIRTHLGAGSPRIRHELLKGSLTSRYGPKEGTKVYKQLVEQLQKKGYR